MHGWGQDGILQPLILCNPQPQLRCNPGVLVNCLIAVRSISPPSLLSTQRTTFPRLLCSGFSGTGHSEAPEGGKKRKTLSLLPVCLCSWFFLLQGSSSCWAALTHGRWEHHHPYFSGALEGASKCVFDFSPLLKVSVSRSVISNFLRPHVL